MSNMAIDPGSLGDEDQKLFTLARAAKARNNVTQSAAVRDISGRTHIATLVALEALTLDALQSTIAAAISTGAVGLEAGVVVGDAPSAAARVAFFEFAGDVPLWHEDETGCITSAN